MPQAKQRRTRSAFDARSVMLFAALTVGGALAQAQTSPVPSAQPKYQAGPAPASAEPKAVFGGGQKPPANDAFNRADANHDGQLSSAEAARLPAVANRFQELDKDKSGALSRAEFDAGTGS